MKEGRQKDVTGLCSQRSTRRKGHKVNRRKGGGGLSARSYGIAGITVPASEENTPQKQQDKRDCRER